MMTTKSPATGENFFKYSFDRNCEFRILISLAFRFSSDEMSDSSEDSVRDQLSVRRQLLSNNINSISNNKLSSEDHNEK